MFYISFLSGFRLFVTRLRYFHSLLIVHGNVFIGTGADLAISHEAMFSLVFLTLSKIVVVL